MHAVFHCAAQSLCGHRHSIKCFSYGLNPPFLERVRAYGRLTMQSVVILLNAIVRPFFPTCEDVDSATLVVKATLFSADVASPQS